MTNVLRRAFYAALGALAVYAWRRIQDAERAMPAAEEACASVVVTIPKSILPPMVAGIAVEVQGILMGDLMPPPDGDDPPGLDPRIWGGE